MLQLQVKNMKKISLLLLLFLFSSQSHAQKWIDIPNSSSKGNIYQINPSSMFTVQDETPLRTLHYGVEIRQVSKNGAVKLLQTIAFKENDCNKSAGTIYIQNENNSETSKTFSKFEDEPYWKIVQTVCNVTKKVLK